jgi:hypothetical protein
MIKADQGVQLELVKCGRQRHSWPGTANSDLFIRIICGVKHFRGPCGD